MLSWQLNDDRFDLSDESAFADVLHMTMCHRIHDMTGGDTTLLSLTFVCQRHAAPTAAARELFKHYCYYLLKGDAE